MYQQLRTVGDILIKNGICSSIVSYWKNFYDITYFFLIHIHAELREVSRLPLHRALYPMSRRRMSCGCRGFYVRPGWTRLINAKGLTRRRILFQKIYTAAKFSYLRTGWKSYDFKIKFIFQDWKWFLAHSAADSLIKYNGARDSKIDNNC